MNISSQISNLNFTDSDSPEQVAQKLVQEWHLSNQSTIVHYIYYASYVLFHSDRKLLNDYLLADYILVDGIGMQICFKIITGKKIANLNGTDMSPLFINQLFKADIPICFYGTTKENIEACDSKLTEQYGAKVLTYFQDGYSPLDKEKIPSHSALFIGMGSPRQERWVTDNIDWIRQQQLLVFTVGGFFDFLSGYYIRAPKWVRAIKMEWMWRTVLHPRRHYQKRLRDMTVVFLPFIHKLKGYKKLIHWKRI